MSKQIKVFLPRWVLLIVLPMLGVIWGMITYQVFATAKGREDLGVVGWLGVTLVIVLVGFMLWLMVSRRLPAYLIEIEEDDELTKR